VEKIAVISDIHGNIPALEAVLQDIKNRNITRIFCLGDLVGKGPHSDTAVDIIKETCEIVVIGNWDIDMSKPHEKEFVTWHQKRLGAARIKYLASLPFSHDFYMSGRFIRLFHASPQSVYNRVQSKASIDEKLTLFDNTEMTGTAENGGTPDVVGYGDIHNAYIQNFNGRTIFNAGSVGNPLEITQASYAVLEGIYDSGDASPFSIQLVRVPYNIELAIKQAEEENMPNIEPYKFELTTAQYRGKMVK
jgi:protein phosphatase